jgi:hypothetical protein
MNHPDVYSLRQIFNEQHIMLCFNGPFSAGLIEEIGKALRNHMQALHDSPSSVSDVFLVYIEMTQNIRRYSVQEKLPEPDAMATIVISRDDSGHYAISAGNVVRPAHGAALVARVEELAGMDKAALKAAFKAQLRSARDEASGNEGGAGLGLIDMTRKSVLPPECTLKRIDDDRSFFSLRVVI